MAYNLWHITYIDRQLSLTRNGNILVWEYVGRVIMLNKLAIT